MKNEDTRKNVLGKKKGFNLFPIKAILKCNIAPPFINLSINI